MFEDEKELEDMSASRVRAFFNGSSMDNFNGLEGLRTCCGAVERSFLGMGPASSADERGRVTGCWVDPDTVG